MPKDHEHSFSYQVRTPGLLLPAGFKQCSKCLMVTDPVGNEYRVGPKSDSEYDSRENHRRSPRRSSMGRKQRSGF